jgi:hypothetical protein
MDAGLPAPALGSTKGSRVAHALIIALLIITIVVVLWTRSGGHHGCRHHGDLWGGGDWSMGPSCRPSMRW